MIEETLRELEPKLQKAVEALKGELATIHTGRASTSLVDNIIVEAYGSKNPLKAVASISIPDPKSILIQPWDRSNISQIETAIRESDLNLSPVNTGDSIRINLPELTEERRKQFVKVAKEKTEEARISIRNARADVWNSVKKAKTAGEIGEDEMYRGETEIQKLVDKYNDIVEGIYTEKEKELLTV